MSGGRQGDRGAALIVALWVCAMVALLAAAFAGTAGMEARRTAALSGAVQARALIDAGIAHALAGSVFRDAPPRIVADGRPYRIAEGDATLTVQVWDEAGRLDLNRADPALLTAVLARVAGPAGKRAAARVLERRDAGLPIRSILELAAPGWLDATDFARAAPLLTIHGASPSGAVAGDRAPEALLAGWPGLSAPDAAALLRLRGTAALPSGDLALRLAPLGLVLNAPAGEVLTVRVKVETAAGARASAEAVVWMAVDGRSAYRILEWREPAPDHAVGDRTRPE